MASENSNPHPSTPPSPTFPFLLLPHDLRLQIYALLFTLPSPYTQPRFQRRPIQPPITRVSRLLRNEALPVFYTLYELNLNLLAFTCPCRHRLILSPGATAWHALPVQRVRNIRVTATLGHFVRSCQHEHAQITNRRVYLVIFIRFYATGSGGRRYDCKVRREESAGRPKGWRYTGDRLPTVKKAIVDAQVEAAVAHVRNVCEVLVGDEKFGKWTAGDLGKLVQWDGIVTA